RRRVEGRQLGLRYRVELLQTHLLVVQTDGVALVDARPCPALTARGRGLRVPPPLVQPALGEPVVEDAAGIARRPIDVADGRERRERAQMWRGGGPPPQPPRSRRRRT